MLLRWVGAVSLKRLNDEIGVVLSAAIDSDGTRLLAEVFDRDRIEARHHFVLLRMDQGRHDTRAQRRMRLDLTVLLVVDAFGHAHDVANRDAPTLAGEAIAAAWA